MALPGQSNANPPTVAVPDIRQLVKRVPGMTSAYSYHPGSQKDKFEGVKQVWFANKRDAPDEEYAIFQAQFNTPITQQRPYIKVSGRWIVEFGYAGVDATSLQLSVVAVCTNTSTLSTVCKEFNDWVWLKKRAREHKFWVFALRGTLNGAGMASSSSVAMHGVVDDLYPRLRVPLSASSLCGHPIFIPGHGAAPPSICTLGGIISIDRQPYGLLSQHPFIDSEVDELNSEDDQDMPANTAAFHYDGRQQDEEVSSDHGSDGGSNSHFHSQQEPMTQAGNTSGDVTQIGPSAAETQANVLSVMEKMDFFDVRIDVLVPLNDIRSEAERSKPGAEVVHTSDWALVDVSKLPIQLRNLTSVNTAGENGSLTIESFHTDGGRFNGEVLIAIANHASSKGQLRNRPMTFPVNGQLLDVLPITLDEPLPQGSSGSWVLSGRRLCGMIVGARGDIARAYMLPIDTLLSEIRQVSGDGEVAISSAISLLAGLTETQNTTPLAAVPASRIKSTGPAILSGAFRRVFGAKSGNDASRSRINKYPDPEPVIPPMLVERRRRFRTGLDSVISSRRPRPTPFPATRSHIGDLDKPKIQFASAWPSSSQVYQPQVSEFKPVLRQPTTVSTQASLDAISDSFDVGRDGQPSIDIDISKTDLKLMITFDGLETVIDELSAFEWATSEAYQVLQAKIEKCMAKVSEAYTDFHERKLYLRYVISETVSDAATPYSTTIFSLRKIGSHTIHQVAKFLANHPLQPFTIHIQIDYSTLQLKAPAGVSSSELLAEQIRLKRRRNINEQRFVSNLDISGIVDMKLVSTILSDDKSLQSMDEKSKGLLADTILRSASRLFLACVYFNISLDFLRHLLFELKLNDNDWPLTSPPSASIRRTMQYEHLRRLGSVMFPVTLPAGGYVKVLPDEVLPIKYVETGDQLIGSGGFSTIHRVVIEPGVISGHETTQGEYALKTFRQSKNGKAHSFFEGELAVLSTLSEAFTSHSHAVRLVTSWSQGDTDYIMFPLAEQNLRNFFLTTEPPMLTAETVRWFLEQLYGLADIVDMIHRIGSRVSPHGVGRSDSSMMGVHHDIKPENILVFRGPGTDAACSTFKLSDFGSTRIESSKAEVGSEFYGTFTYVAPDYKLTGTVSRPADIWSLGSVFLEMMIWLFVPGIAEEETETKLKSAQQGQFDIKVFSDAKINANKDSDVWSVFGANWVRRDEQVVLNPVVVVALDQLQHEYCRRLPVFERIVDMIRTMLAINSQNRPTAQEVVRIMALLIKQASNELDERSSFYLHPSQRVTPAESRTSREAHRASVSEVNYKAPSALPLNDTEIH